MGEPLDPTMWPRYVFHHTKAPALVTTPEEEAALGEGWRREQWTPEAAAEAKKPLDRTKYPAVRKEVEEGQEDRAAQRKMTARAAALEERSARRQEQLARKRERDKVSAQRRKTEAAMMRDIERKREEERQVAAEARAVAEARRLQIEEDEHRRREDILKAGRPRRKR